MNKCLLSKVFYSSIVSYIIVAKLLVIQWYDFIIIYNDLIIIICCVYSLLFLWGIKLKIKFKIVGLMTIASSLFIQFFYGLYIYLTKDYNHDLIYSLLVFDIPNALSIILLIISFKLIITNGQT